MNTMKTPRFTVVGQYLDRQGIEALLRLRADKEMEWDDRGTGR